MPWWMMRFGLVREAEGGGGGAAPAAGASLMGGAGGSADAAAAPADAAAQGGGASPAAPADGAGAGADWVASLAPELRGVVQTKGWKTPADALAAYSQLEGTLGRDKVALPGKDAKPEDWDAVWNKLGRPESADAYDLKEFQPPQGLPWDGELQKSMLGEMHKAGLTNGQAVGVLKAYGAAMEQQAKAMEETAASFAKQAEQDLRKTWGADYDAKLQRANEAVKAAFGDDLQAVTQLRLADGTYVLDNPLLAKAFALMGERIGEDGDLAGIQGAGGAPAVRTPAQAKAEIERIRGEAVTDAAHPYVNRKHPEYKAMQARMNELYALASSG